MPTTTASFLLSSSCQNFCHFFLTFPYRILPRNFLLLMNRIFTCLQVQRRSRKRTAMGPPFLTKTTATGNTVVVKYQQSWRFIPLENTILDHIFREQHLETEECCLTFHSVEAKIAFEVIDILIYMQEKAWRYSWNSYLKKFSIVTNVSRVHECHGHWMHVCLEQAIRRRFISWEDYTGLHLLASLGIPLFFLFFVSSYG
jgi:hypothetical protein